MARSFTGHPELRFVQQQRKKETDQYEAKRDAQNKELEDKRLSV